MHYKVIVNKRDRHNVVRSSVYVMMNTDNVGHTRRSQTSTRRDALDGFMFVVLIFVMSGSVVHGEASHDVFASSQHLRQLAESERKLVSAFQRYVADERQRLQHIVRYVQTRPRPPAATQ